MTGMSTKPTPYEKRRRNTERRLRQALKRLQDGTPNHHSLKGRPYRLSIATLAREARVGRNTIYTNHRPIIDELNRVKPSAPASGRASAEQRIAELSALITQLQQDKRQLATHNAALLKRAIDAEISATRLEKQVARLTRERVAATRPIALTRP